MHANCDHEIAVTHPSKYFEIAWNSIVLSLVTSQYLWCPVCHAHGKCYRWDRKQIQLSVQSSFIFLSICLSSIHPSSIHHACIHASIHPSLVHPSFIHPFIHHSFIRHSSIHPSSIHHPSFDYLYFKKGYKIHTHVHSSIIHNGEKVEAIQANK